MSDGRIKAFFVASAHWDREWYRPFQGFRYDLVELMDEVLATMQRDPRYAVFDTDGQSVLVEDYLEIRPQREAEVRRLADAGRLRIGPWYTMPDENIVAGESLVRNLEEGLRVAAEYGHASRVGFVCDLFGHCSQLPQILRGFGIDSAFVYRGLNEDTHGSVFRWRSPDGSEVVTHRFGPREGYFDYACYVRKAYEPGIPFVLEEAARRLSEYVDIQRGRDELDVILLFDGGDHMPIEPRSPELLDLVRRARPDVEIVHTGLREFAEALNERLDRIPRVFTGELRDPGRQVNDGSCLIPGVLSSRMYLKQANRACEAGLCLWAEPFGHLASRLTGREYPHAFLRHSWRHLLLNHAHDSICGCSPDQVHRDMEYRFDQCRLISDRLTEAALESIATRVDLPDLAGENFALVVFNPTQVDIDGPVDLDLWFNEKTEQVYAEFFNDESKVGFRLHDADGNELAYDYLHYERQRRRFYRLPGKVPVGEGCVVVTATVNLRVPAFGYMTVTCTPEKRATRYPQGGIVRNDRTLENEHLRVTVEADGALELHDKRTGQTYHRLLIFEDRADIGDGWYHGVAVNDRIHSSTACATDVAIVADGARKGVLRVINRMVVPECFEFGGKMRRSERAAALLIVNEVTLRAAADYLEIRTVMDNSVRDHRIRVMFETHARTDTYLADSAFDVIERPIALPEENHTYRELAVETTPHANWTAVFDKQRGLAVVAPGLPETAVRDVPERTLALTLLRGFRRTIFTDGEDGGQCLGRNEFHYRLVPLAGEPERARLTAHGQQIAGGLRTFQVLPRNQAAAGGRSLPPALGQLSLDPGKAIVTSLRRRPGGDALEVRLCNLYDREISETLRFHEPVGSAVLTNLGREALQALPVKDRAVVLKIPPRKVATVAIEFARG